MVRSARQRPIAPQAEPAAVREIEGRDREAPSDCEAIEATAVSRPEALVGDSHGLNGWIAQSGSLFAPICAVRPLDPAIGHDGAQHVPRASHAQRGIARQARSPDVAVAALQFQNVSGLSYSECLARILTRTRPRLAAICACKIRCSGRLCLSVPQERVSGEHGNCQNK
jgi:hypothetical protein